MTVSLQKMVFHKEMFWVPSCLPSDLILYQSRLDFVELGVVMGRTLTSVLVPADDLLTASTKAAMMNRIPFAKDKVTILYFTPLNCIVMVLPHTNVAALVRSWNYWLKLLL